jgi:outer membrane protein W
MRPRWEGIASAAIVVCLWASSAEAQDIDLRQGGRILFLPGVTTSGEVGGTGMRLELSSGIGLEYEAVVRFSDLFGAEFTVGGIYHSLDVTDGCCDGLDGGSVWLFPLTAMAQIHLPLSGTWDPYAGLGIAMVFPYYRYSADLGDAGVERLDLEGDAGLAAQIGINYAIDRRWRANLDLRYLGVTLDARVRTIDGDLQPVSLDIKPLVIGLGLNYRF